jgi:hypothetical protein
VYFFHNGTYYQLRPTTSPYAIKFIGRLRWYWPFAEEHVGLTTDEFEVLFQNICQTIGLKQTKQRLFLEQVHSLRTKRFTVRQYILKLPKTLVVPTIYVMPCAANPL